MRTSETIFVAAGDQDVRRRNNVCFVEFFGLPGSGKTTVAGQVAQVLSAGESPMTDAVALLTSRPRPIVWQMGRVANIAAALGRKEYRGLCRRIIRYVRQGEQQSPTDLTKVTWNLLSVTAQIVRNRSRERQLILLDQGVLQGIWSVLLTSKGKSTTEPYLDIIRDIIRDDFIFVFLDAEPALAESRLLSRREHSSRMQRPQPKGSMINWARAVATTCRLSKEVVAAVRNGGLSVSMLQIPVEAARTPAEIVEEVLQKLLADRRIAG